MSVQLIVFPQNFDGVTNAISGSSTEFIVNGISFNNLSTANSYDSNTSSIGSVSMIDTLINQSPVVNVWQRFRTTSSGTPTLPTSTSNNLVLSAASTSSSSGVYQKLTNLTIGQNYTLTINSASIPAGKYQIGVFNSNNSISTWSTNTIPSTSFSITYTASDTAMTFFISYQNTSATTWTINDISVQPVVGAVNSGAIQLLENGQVICDLYEDEDIPLSLSVDDFKNVAEKVQSYSKAFNLPATKRNKRIFDNIFEITRSDDGVIFNPYKKTKCVLKQDGFILFEGYLRLLDVTDKEKETSYNVNLYSEVIALVDVLGDGTFRDLNFEELEHDYNLTNIQATWSATGVTYTNPSTSGFRSATTVKYPFVDWNHQFILGASGNPVLPNLEAAFRPFINIKYIIDRIFEATPFTYESLFFNTDDFKKLYMDFNWGSGDSPVTIFENGAGKLAVSQTATTSFVTIQTNDNTFSDNIGYSAGVYTAINNNQTYFIDYFYFYTVTGSGAWTGEFRWKMVKGGVTSYTNIIPVSGTGASIITITGGNVTELLNAGDTLTPEFKSASAGTHTITLSNPVALGSVGITYVLTSAAAATNNTLLQTLRGELGQWDFLKGILTMFNLVTLPDEDNPNNIKIETYSDVFINSTDSVQLDWTDKIDVSEMKLTPLADLNKKTIFKFVEDDDDYSFNQYKNQVGGHLYGSQMFNAGNEFNILVGEDEIVAEPFAATIVKPLEDNFPEFITPAIYSYSPNDDTSEGFENSPRIMYDNDAVTMNTTTYSIPAQNGVVGNALETQFLQFSHLSDIPTIEATSSVAGSRDFHFGDCQLMPGVGEPVPDNLFNLYWLPYYLELYNPNTRIMTIKVNLTPADINTFKFNDTIFIKNRIFRCNKIDYKPNDLATVEFILIP